MSGTNQNAAGSPPAPASASPARTRRYDFWQFPVTAACIVVAVAITAAATLGIDVDALAEGPQVGQGQVWRLVTSAFVHVAFWHILFNLFWLWEFGPLLEVRFGSLRTALLILLLALGSGAFDYGLSSGGIGLSGVIYGLFGTLWVLAERDVRFAGALSQSTLRTFVIWFFACIALTYAGLLNVANVAHGAGFVFGVLVGLAITTPRWRAAIGSVTAALLAFGVWSATVGREAVNLSGSLGEEEGRLGYQALVVHQDAAALRWLQQATRLQQPATAANWNNLAVAYARLGRDQEAQAAEAQSAKLKGEPDPTQ